MALIGSPGWAGGGAYPGHVGRDGFAGGLVGWHVHDSQAFGAGRRDQRFAGELAFGGVAQRMGREDAVERRVPAKRVMGPGLAEYGAGVVRQALKLPAAERALVLEELAAAIAVLPVLLGSTGKRPWLFAS